LEDARILLEDYWTVIDEMERHVKTMNGLMKKEKE
jgi:hypothetical protein